MLLPIPPALLVAAGVMAIRHPERRRAILSVVLITGLVAFVIVLPWFADQWRVIQLNGGVALDSSDTLEAARFGFWSYPRQFGLILPLAVIGAGVALLFLRRADGPRTDDGAGRWAPSPPEGALVLVAWAAIAFGLAVLYRPDWPLEDALRPQRLWLIASQPITILAAIGLVAAAEYLFGRVWRRPRWIVPAVVGVVVLVAVPSTFATVRLAVSDMGPAGLRSARPGQRSRARLRGPAGRWSTVGRADLRGLVGAVVVRNRFEGGGARPAWVRQARLRPGNLHRT